MKITLNVFNQTKIPIKEEKKWIKDIFTHVREDHAFNVIFVDDAQIKAINHQYRGIDKVTDVLSFPDSEGNYIGDIFISLDQAKRQAEDYQHPLKREIGFLVTHGYLHLLGYDHQTKEDEALMRMKQEAILKKADLERK